MPIFKHAPLTPDQKTLITRGSATGLISGGILSINAGDNTKYDLTAGSAQIVDNVTNPVNPTFQIVSWVAQTAVTVTNIATLPQTFVGVQADGTFPQQLLQFSQDQLRDIVQLGVLAHPTGVISSVTDARIAIAINPDLNFYDLQFAMGPVNVSGNQISANGSNLNINKSSGISMIAGINFANDPKNPNIFTEAAQTAAFFITFGNDGAGNAAVFGVGTNIDPSNYDDGSGTLASVPTNNYTIQRIFYGLGNGLIAVKYGQNLYTSQLAAVTSIQDESIIRFAIEGPVLLLASLVVRSGATDLTDDNQAVFIQASKFGDLKFLGSSKDVSTRAIPAYKSYTFTSRGVGSGLHYVGGYYDYPATDSNLTNASTTQAYGTANIGYSAHAFVVAAAAGVTDGSDLVLTVTGTSITNAGVRTGSDSEIVVADCTAAATDQYFETDKHWIGTVTYTLSSTGGTTFNFDFNYGFAKYDDLGNRDFVIKEFEAVGEAGINDSAFDIELLEHGSAGWTYSAAAFIAGGNCIAQWSTDMAPEDDLSNGKDFGYKRSGLTTFIEGSLNNGYLIRITTGANNSVQTMDTHVGVEF
jgi:hypothetical protein